MKRNPHKDRRNIPRDARLILVVRALRGFADGLVSVLLAGHLTRLFAWYNVAANFMGAVGALASGLPALVARLSGIDVVLAERGGFVVYALVGLVGGALYLGLGPAVEAGRPSPGRPLAHSRRVV